MLALGQGVIDPWRCQSCKRLVYNLDHEGHPCAGAPLPLYVSSDYNAVCSVCYDMFAAVEKADWTYWHSGPIKGKVSPDPVDRHC